MLGLPIRGMGPARAWRWKSDLHPAPRPPGLVVDRWPCRRKRPGGGAVGRPGRGHDGWVGDLDAVMRLIAFLQAQNGDKSTLGSVDRRLSGSGRRSRAASFSTYLRYSSRVVAPSPCSSHARHVSRVAASMELRLARARHVCSSSMKDDPARLRGDQKLLETLPGCFAPAIRPAMSSENRLAAKAVGRLIIDDALRQTLDHGRLARAGTVALRCRICASCGGSRRHDRSRDQACLTGALGQVDRVFLERLGVAFHRGCRPCRRRGRFQPPLPMAARVSPAFLRKTARLAP